jgi:hypothetical protein
VRTGHLPLPKVIGGRAERYEYLYGSKWQTRARAGFHAAGIHRPNRGFGILAAPAPTLFSRCINDGVIAPNALQRGRVTPTVLPLVTPIEDGYTVNASPTDPRTETKANSARHLTRYSWARLIARVYETNSLRCGHCAGRTKIIAFLVQVTGLRD